MKNKRNSGQRLTLDILIIIILLICLTITSAAIVYSTVSMDNNLFHTGVVKINLNDGKPVIQEHEFLFEPGMRVQREFFIQNQSSCDVYYRFYFDDVEGDLADYLEITISENGQVLYQGSALSMTREAALAADDMLRLNERRDFTILFYFPPESGNDAQNMTLSFNLCADAVQTKNNPYKLFD